MKRTCVLIVDDQLDFLSLLQYVLEAEGFYVGAAEDGAAAMELLGQFRPALILTDLMMPNVHGVDLIAYVRQTPEIARIPIIALSAGTDDLFNEAMQAGANEVIRKPVDMLDLVHVVKRYTDAKAQEGMGN